MAEDDSSLRCVLRQHKRPTCDRGRKAADLLAQPAGLRISDIACGCGFNDLSCFNRCFRCRYGLTPTAARGRQVYSLETVGGSAIKTSDNLTQLVPRLRVTM